jgi:hypothetical protein
MWWMKFSMSLSGQGRLLQSGGPCSTPPRFNYATAARGRRPGRGALGGAGVGGADDSKLATYLFNSVTLMNARTPSCCTRISPALIRRYNIARQIRKMDAASVSEARNAGRDACSTIDASVIDSASTDILAQIRIS